MEIIKTFGYIKNNLGKFDVCLVDHLGQLWLATYDPIEDEIDTLATVTDLEDAQKKAARMFRTQDEYVVTANKYINAAEETNMDNNEILFTPAALLDFLRQIDELSDKDIIVNDTDATITVTIGDSTYGISTGNAEEVEVADEVVDEVAEINDTAYEEMDDVEFTEISEEEVVEGGIIKEALKTLAVGGLVRLTGKILGKDVADSLK